MPDSPRDTNPASRIPKMTALSIAFPMTFESANPAPTDPRRASTNQPESSRAPHRHDAGE